MTPPEHSVRLAASALEPDEGAEGSVPWFPGPLVRKLLLVAVCAVVLSGALAYWLVSRAVGQESMQRLVGQQTDEVELVARLLASKIEQSQKVLATVAESITPEMLESPSSLEWLLQQGLPAVRFFDAIQVARKDGHLSVNLRYGRLENAAGLDPTERDYLVRTMVNGKPLVSDLIGTTAADARVMFTLPLVQGEGRVIGAVAGVLRLQSQGLLPHSLALPARSESRLIVFTREGVILSHPNLERLLGDVAQEPGLADAYARWRRTSRPSSGRGETQTLARHVVSLATVPLPQWVVARVSDSRELLEPLEGSQRRAGWQAVGAVAGVAVLALVVMAWLARPLALLRQRACAVIASEGESQWGDPPDEPPWPGGAGEVDDVVRVCRRLLERRRLQQRGSETVARQLQAVLDHAPLGIVLTRGDRIEVASLQACRLLGYAPQELQGAGVKMLLLFREGKDWEFASVRAQFQAHGAFDGELPLRHKDGATVWVHARGRSLHPGELARGTVWTLEDCTAEREARQQQTWEATHDVLTLLINRVAFEQRLQVLLAERAGREDGQSKDDCGVLLFLDLDHLTVVNDVAGHSAGDDVLRHLARLIEAEVRQIGWVARLGGDEFAVVLPACPLARGLEVAERLRAAVHAWEPSYHGRSFTLGVSIGVVALEAGPQDVAAVLYTADMACYDAKRAGRNRVSVRPMRNAAAPR